MCKGLSMQDQSHCLSSRPTAKQESSLDLGVSCHSVQCELCFIYETAIPLRLHNFHWNSAVLVSSEEGDSYTFNQSWADTSISWTHSHTHTIFYIYIIYSLDLEADRQIEWYKKINFSKRFKTQEGFTVKKTYTHYLPYRNAVPPRSNMVHWIRSKVLEKIYNEIER